MQSLLYFLMGQSRCLHLKSRIGLSFSGMDCFLLITVSLWLYEMNTQFITLSFPPFHSQSQICTYGQLLEMSICFVPLEPCHMFLGAQLTTTKIPVSSIEIFAEKLNQNMLSIISWWLISGSTGCTGRCPNSQQSTPIRVFPFWSLWWELTRTF